MDSAPLLQVRRLTAGYGRRPVLRDVDLSVAPGEVVALVGANGSGKSTLLRTVSGLADLMEGEIALAGRRIERMPAWKRHRVGLGHVPQRGAVFVEMRVVENLRLAALSSARTNSGLRARLDLVAEVFPSLSGLLDRKANTLSGGERQMVALARALMTRPKLLMVDEPTQGLAEGLVEGLLRTLRFLADEQGLGILLVEHRVEPALRQSDRAIGLRSGRKVWDSPAAELAADPAALAGIFGLADQQSGGELTFRAASAKPDVGARRSTDLSTES